MKERGKVFPSEMVRAILEGRKTQFREVIKPQPYIELGPDGEPGPLAWDGGKANFSGLPEWLAQDWCPYQPGDRPWVRETWTIGAGSKNFAFYKATEDKPGYAVWRASTQMPKKYSRITLEITKVRVERVQDISEEDSIAEGVEATRENSGIAKLHIRTPRFNFMLLWNSINEKRGHGWDKNDWVWVGEFKVLK